MSPLLLAAMLAAFLTSWGITAVVRRYAIANAIMDLPNARSAHHVPTPRGGGLAIASVVLSGVSLLAIAGAVAPSLALALVGGGAMVAITGWLDDARGLSPALRGAVHLVAASWAVYWLGGLPQLTLGTVTFELGRVGALLGVIGIVWAVNLYNFMDGIDGLAASEACVVGVAGGVLLLMAGAPGLAAVALLSAAASGGFLVWNWSPARLFMGDVGSGLIGFVFAVLALVSERSGTLPLVIWILLLAVFIFDATVTLLRRVVRGERWYAAHATHAYQRAVRAGWSHAQVTSAVIALNVTLAALAMATVDYPRFTAVVLLLVAAGLACVYLLVERIRPM